MSSQLSLTLDTANIQPAQPLPKAVSMLQERGYAQYDVHRIAQALSDELQFAPIDPKIHEAIFKKFVRAYIVPSPSSALFNETRRNAKQVYH